MDFFSFFRKKQTPPSGSVAKDRLKLVLVHDKVISNYMEIDTDELDIQITQTQSEDNNGTVPVLYANIPIKSMRKMNHED